MPLTRNDVMAIIRRVRYLDWKFRLTTLRQVTDGFLLQVVFDVVGDRQSGRLWYISKDACPSEVVQTCLKAVLTAVEHEAREKFLFDGVAIFGPHLDVEALKAVRHQVRDDTHSPTFHSYGDAPCPACGDLDGCHDSRPVTTDY